MSLLLVHAEVYEHYGWWAEDPGSFYVFQASGGRAGWQVDLTTSQAHRQRRASKRLRWWLRIFSAAGLGNPSATKVTPRPSDSYF
mmetsp:Transcript_5671/g.11622  ORF Transcript_5671/g.11622 Transcript_5671/m.11622 type:complete len:85 (-) Transcript_5671:853-1107(-)